MPLEHQAREVHRVQQETKVLRDHKVLLAFLALLEKKDQLDARDQEVQTVHKDHKVLVVRRVQEE